MGFIMILDLFSLKGKTAVVTGANTGLGQGICVALAQAGASVIGVARRSCADTAEKIAEFNGSFSELIVDLSTPDAVDKIIEGIDSLGGNVDILVNNAGINLPRLLVDVKGEKPEYELNEDSFGKMFAVNVKGVFLCAQAVARELVKQGHGVILNMSSESGKEGSQGQSAYSATKGAVDSFTRSWAKELGKYNVRVVACAPGIMEATGLRTTAYNEALAYTRGVKPEDLSTDYSKVIPIGRDGKLDEVGSLVAYLVSDQASYITGTTVNISGGKSRG